MMNAYELSLHGVGISIYPASISSLIRDKDVCVREVEHPDAHASYALIWNKIIPCPMWLKNLLLM